MARKYWLFKTEPGSYSIDDLMNDGVTYWDGIRNYQARNILRDDVNIGDEVLIYHSNANPPAIVGIAQVVKAGYPDHTQFDAGSNHFDPKAKEDDPRWFMVDVQFVKKLARPITIDDVKGHKALSGMVLINNSRLSAQPVSQKEWEAVLQMAAER